jgi:drug/metabolite transporter (DMT)-like permease
METHVFLLVLLGAALHASWNALLKTGGDKMGAMALMSLGHAIPALVLLPFVGWIEAAAWPWLAASVLLHVGYRIYLVKAYEAGEMTQVYPLARGSAPLLTMLVALLAFNETVRPFAIAGIVVISLGIVLMSQKGGADLGRMDGKVVVLALATALFICGYTIADGYGARAGGNAAAYAALLFILDTPLTVLVAWLMRGQALFRGMRIVLVPGLAGGAISFFAYAIAIWAMTVAPVPLVAALRETSVLFGVAIAILFLGERLTGPRIGAAALMVAGVVLLRLA